MGPLTRARCYRGVAVAKLAVEDDRSLVYESRGMVAPHWIQSVAPRPRRRTGDFARCGMEVAAAACPDSDYHYILDLEVSSVAGEEVFLAVRDSV